MQRIYRFENITETILFGSGSRTSSTSFIIYGKSLLLPQGFGPRGPQKTTKKPKKTEEAYIEVPARNMIGIYQRQRNLSF
jgi:hypothetical protein